MTLVLYGDRAEVIARLAKIPNATKRTFDELTDKKEKLDATKFAWEWSARSIPPRPIIYVDPPLKLDPTGLPPRGDRVVVFTDGKELPPLWQAWAEANPDVTVENRQPPDPEALVQWLMKGSVAKAVPKFTEDAARHIVAAHPGAQALALAVHAVKCFELQVPVSYRDVVELWPYIPKTGKAHYAVNGTDLLRGLCKQRSLELGILNDEKQSSSALRFLLSACKRSPDRVELINTLMDGKMYKQISSWKVALLLFLHHEFQQGAPSSASKSASSSLTGLNRYARLSGFPSAPTW